MNPLAGAGAWVAHHQVAAGAAAVGGVAGLALLRRRKATAAGSPAAGVAQQGIPVSTADTTATDLYNALQPQIEQVLSAVQASNAQQALAANSQVPSQNPFAQQPVTQQQPPPPTPKPADPAPPVPSLQAVYGAPVAPYTLDQYPAAGAGSVAAPPGGVFSYGEWDGGVLTKGVYFLPDGTTVSKGY